ncbi:MAG: hypothetical protein KatS3mg004_3174 [Bryobacteraceae bacterium]|nr:MAG: hypothetical protein KatS3mg004_3174 [Bryobacteraceae bacterium]
MIKPNALAFSSAVLVPGSPAMPWEETDVLHGTVHQHFSASRVAGDRRDYFVYTPPNYAPKKRYPLPVLCHGLSDYANGWTAAGRPTSSSTISSRAARSARSSWSWRSAAACPWS